MVLPYDLVKDAESDLREVAHYTLRTWGVDALNKYRKGLKQTFLAICRGEIVNTAFSDRFSQLLVTKYKYHYIFYIVEGREKPIIIGVIHERRDIVNRLKERLK